MATPVVSKVIQAEELRLIMSPGPAECLLAVAALDHLRTPKTAKAAKAAKAAKWASGRSVAMLATLAVFNLKRPHTRPMHHSSGSSDGRSR